MSMKNGLKAEIKLMKEQMVSEKLLLLRQSRFPWCWKSSSSSPFLLPSLCSHGPGSDSLSPCKPQQAAVERGRIPKPCSSLSPPCSTRNVTSPCHAPCQDHTLSAAPPLTFTSCHWCQHHPGPVWVPFATGASTVLAQSGSPLPCSGAPYPPPGVRLCHLCSINSAPSAPQSLCT